MAEEQLIGEITHFYNKISVGIIKLSSELKVGDGIHIAGNSTDLTQQVESMQVEHQDVTQAKRGDDVGIKVNGRVHPGDKVFLVKP